jgi:hypothetical protein
MTPADLAARAAASRQMDIGPFRVQLPDQLTVRQRAARLPEDDADALREFEEQLPVDCLLGWSLTIGDIAPGDADAASALPFDLALWPVIAAERRDLRLDLVKGFWEAMEARRKRFEEDRKN